MCRGREVLALSTTLKSWRTRLEEDDEDPKRVGSTWRRMNGMVSTSNKQPRRLRADQYVDALSASHV